MDFIFLSKFLSAFIYPLNLFLLLCLLAWFIKHALFKKIIYGLSFSLLLICSNSFIAKTLLSNLERQHASLEITTDSESADFIILLGGGLGLPLPPRTEPNFNSDSNRITYAKYLYDKGAADKILITGGNVFAQDADIKSEAFYTKQLLVSFGVNADDIFIEEQSRSTYENALYSKPILSQNNVQSALLVTSAYHMPRAYSVFQSQFADSHIQIQAAPTDYAIVDYKAPTILGWIPSTNALMASNVAIKEWVGYWVYQYKGFIDKP